MNTHQITETFKLKHPYVKIYTYETIFYIFITITRVL